MVGSYVTYTHLHTLTQCQQTRLFSYFPFYNYSSPNIAIINEYLASLLPQIYADMPESRTRLVFWCFHVYIQVCLQTGANISSIFGLTPGHKCGEYMSTGDHRNNKNVCTITFCYQLIVIFLVWNYVKVIYNSCIFQPCCLFMLCCFICL